MKQFSKFNNKQYVNLKNIDESLINNIKNLDGQQINECCCDCCCSSPCSNCITNNPLVYFYSENEIIEKLLTQPKVQDIYNLHTQFGNRFRHNENPEDASEPLYFSEILPDRILVQCKNGRAQDNQSLYEFIKTLCRTYGMGSPVVLDRRINGNVQLFFNTNRGTNGVEGSIKSSLEEISKLMGDLQKMEEVTWVQILDVSIDQADDVYTFVVTCTIDITKFPIINNQNYENLKVDKDVKKDVKVK
jgi:hypothetical protein